MKKWLCLVALCLLSGCAPQTVQAPSPSPALQSPEPSVVPTATPEASVVPSVIPEATAEPTTEPENKIIASAVTKIYDKNANRTHNLKIAARAVNGTVVKPNETFSFNRKVGPRTEAKGYKEAPVLVGTEHEKGIGGGVCQVSTTIFNAAEKAGLEIVERHKHQLPVAYAKNGTDATVNYGTMDMRFKNTKSYNIVIQVSVKKSKVTVTMTKE